MLTVGELSLPPSDEPFDFRRQAAVYARYRRDYSPALYAAVAERTGPAAGRLAVDLGCGTGFVAAGLRARGWRTLGVDFSGPMLAEARRLLAGIHLISARAEGLPLRDAVAGLVTCGTAFHWFPPVPAMAEIERVLAPGGWVALFWRYEAPGEPYMAVVGECLREIGVAVPGFGSDLQVHPAEPFAGSRLVPEATLTLASELEFTVDSFHGYVSTVEWIRRLAGPRHEELLRRLREELARRWPAGFRERTHEYLFCASRPAGAHR